MIGAWHDLVYHERLGMTILVNGGPESGLAADAPLELWSWNGSMWRQLESRGLPSVPSWRNFASVAYDSDRGVILLHGGLQGRGAPMDETWEWDGETWVGNKVAGPGGREGASMAYDRARRLTVLVGGADERGIRSDTWGWDGGTWRRLADGGPSARFPGFLEFDQAHGNLVLYGGHAIDGPTALGDTWLWDGTSWRRSSAQSAPGPRVNTNAIFHTRLGRLVMIGGGSDTAAREEIWAWNGANWTRLADTDLPPRQGNGLAYDQARDRVVLTGGLDQPGTPTRYQDVWEWDGSRFARVFAG